MFSLAMLSVALFLGIAATSSARDAANSIYFRYFDKPGTFAALAAGAARGAAVLFAGLFYFCVGVGILGLIYAAVLFTVFVHDAFIG